MIFSVDKEYVVKLGLTALEIFCVNFLFNDMLLLF